MKTKDGTDPVGKKVADRLGLDQAYTELLPADKVGRVEKLLKQKSEKGKLVFVGDGINDAPVLTSVDMVLSGLKSFRTQRVFSLLVENCGIIHRKVIPEKLPKTMYSLTSLGKSMIPILDAMCQWGSLFFF